ncbi:nuclear pore complex component-domain-containing protein [Neohortaea acidophila]|uniref:Nuclear pore complex component-domain-containing protein n=1 Tax=Neohortaea acidophila TaxID=245834 RepID=A0A6A6PU86_9PEZI|nr:nuclear pore complex component-domain-containing protein [Neohortaea acidophila]KAF2483679.1 nuclear pore complex component-domain-containing protein [Neohortaea acidophila]
MSTTALVRSPSSTTALTAPTAQVKPTSSSSTSSALLPKLGSSPPQKTTGSPKPGTPKLSQQQQQQQQLAASSTPGRWQHPRLNEITQRQSRTNFDRSNVFAVLWSCFFLFLSFGVHSVLHTVVPTNTLVSLGKTPTYTLLATRLLILANITLSLAPLFRTPDACEDIPLSPTQRKLFGLPPLSRPATPQEKEQWVTPPRYARSASGTPLSATSSLQPEVSGSPLDFSGRKSSFPNSPAFRSPSGSPASAMGTRHGSGERRRLSYTATRSSPLSVSEFDAAGSVNTPTKTNHRASVGLNNKWLYEKGKANGSGWGTGSVFS